MAITIHQSDLKNEVRAEKKRGNFDSSAGPARRNRGKNIRSAGKNTERKSPSNQELKNRHGFTGFSCKCEVIFGIF